MFYSAVWLPITEPQLIAEAIAAFYEKNRRRKQIGRSPILSKVFAGITLTGMLRRSTRFPSQKIFSTVSPLPSTQLRKPLFAN